MREREVAKYEREERKEESREEIKSGGKGVIARQEK